MEKFYQLKLNVLLGLSLKKDLLCQLWLKDIYD